MKNSTTAVVALGAGLLIAVGAPLAASAHVTVSPNTAEPGGYSLITVKVPNESATASTVKVSIALPADTPFTSVSYVPVPGWTGELSRSTLPTPVTVGENTITEAVTAVTWTADDAVGITAGQLQLFPISVGAVPDIGQLTLPATQTYSDGTVVNWDGSGDEPAPVLYVNDEPADDHHAAGPSVDTVELHDSPQSDVLARVFGIAGLALGAIAVVIAIVALRRMTGGTK
ncbi:YcnI family protein [soil metagenome]